MPGQTWAVKYAKMVDRRAKAKAAGKCTACGKACAVAENGRIMRMCRRHLDQLAAQQRRFHDRQRAAKRVA